MTMTQSLLILALVAALLLVYRHYRAPIRHRWRRRQAREMLKQFCGRDRDQPAVLHFSRLRAMDALAFEELLLEAFERRGFRVIRNQRYSGDGGFDGQVVIAGRTWLIQAKRYASAIRPEHVRDFAALCSRHGQPGLFIHTGRTGGQSREALAGLTDIEIISGQRLLALLTGAPFSVPSSDEQRTVGTPHARWVTAARSWVVIMSARRQHRPFWLLFYAVTAFMVAPTDAAAKSSREDDVHIGRCIKAAARGRPWLEQTLWGLRDQEAGWLGAEITNSNGTHDLGPLQINSWWVPRFARMLGREERHIRHWLRYDPCFNAEAARWIFLAALEQTGDYWKAVGVYHSPTPWRQRRYALLVAGHMRERFNRR